MNIEFRIIVSVSRQRGKFASHDELAQQIADALDQANPGELTGENGGEYTVDEWDIQEQVK